MNRPWTDLVGLPHKPMGALAPPRSGRAARTGFTAYAAFLLVAALASAASAASAKRYALVVGVNRPAAADLAPLRFADDDAARTWEIFSNVPGEALLLTVLDPESQRLHPEATRAAQPPTLENVHAAALHLFERVAAARAQGARTELYFIYSGHGRADERGEGGLELADGRLTRRALYEEIVARSPADANHLVIDACDAYFFVNSRGGGDAALDAELRQRAREFLERESLEKWPSTGALLSTSGAAESHEWSAIQAGVFSHLFRSALLGAADANGDGKVSYTEVQAFVAAAGARMRHAKARVSVYARAPAKDLAGVLFEPAAVGENALVLDAAQAGRTSVEDDRGVRYADLNKSAEHELRLALLPRGKYYVTTALGEYALEPRGEVRLAALTAGAPRALARGGVAEALDKDLFAVPFGPSFYEGWRTRDDAERAAVALAPTPAPRPLLWAALGVGAGAVVASGAGVGYLLAAGSSFQAYLDATNPQEIAQAQALTQERDQKANFALGAALGLGATALGLWIADLLAE